MRRTAWTSLVLGFGLLTVTAKPVKTAAAAKGDYVILLHGSGRTAWSMKRLELRLKHSGYRVINESYPSWNTPVEKLAEDYLAKLLRERITDPGTRVHFVTHSLGGILVRQYLARHDLPQLGRVVMLGPPNGGSEVVDHLRTWGLTRTLLGTSRLPLGTGAADLPRRLGPVQFECGIIAGDRSLNPLLSRWLPRPNDGKVSVASARVDGMRDFLVVHHTHTWMMQRESVIRQVLAFLQTGNFERPLASGRAVG